MRMASLRYMGMNQSTQSAEGGLLATTFRIQSMTCGACVRHPAEALEALPGVVHVAVDLTRKEGRVDHLARWVGDSALIEAVADAAYVAHLVTNTAAVSKRIREASRPGANSCCCG